MRWRRQAWAYGFILPAACAIGLAFGYPLTRVIRFSFQSGSVGDLTDVGLQNYAWLWEDPVFVHAALNNLNAAGIRTRMRPMERAAFYAAWQEKKLRGVFLVAVGNSGNAASRVEAFIYSKGSYAYGGYPDLDEMFLQQARERDPAKREAILYRIQQLTIDRAMFAPLMDLRGIIGVGPRVADHTINVIPMYPFPSYEDVRLKSP
jgi:peptide/nickel transport system substrate-binding protein